MPRPIWKGAITLGLVRIPVQMFTALQDRAPRFHRVTPDGRCRLRTKLVCPETGEAFDFEAAARGFEIAPGQFVLVSEQEMSALAPEAGHTIAIEDFVSQDEIDPVYYDRPYYLGPDMGGQRSYRLLFEALQRSGKVAIARFVMRTKQHLAALRPSQGGLVLSTMFYADEVESLTDTLAPVLSPEVAPEAEQVALAMELISRMTVPFEATRYRDTVRDQLVELLERKAEGEQLPQPEAAPAQGQVVDLREALQQSLAAREGKARKKGKSAAS
jgi:DNA end-binding protein Ku